MYHTSSTLDKAVFVLTSPRQTAPFLSYHHIPRKTNHFDHSPPQTIHGPIKYLLMRLVFVSFCARQPVSALGSRESCQMRHKIITKNKNICYTFISQSDFYIYTCANIGLDFVIEYYIDPELVSSLIRLRHPTCCA